MPQPNPHRPGDTRRRRRLREWRAQDAARDNAAWERERQRRKERRQGNRPNPQFRRPTVPLGPLADALAAGVSPGQAAAEAGVPLLVVNRALREDVVQRAYQSCQELQQTLRSALRRSAPPKEAPRRNVLAATAGPLAAALDAGVSMGQAAADVGVAPSSITRALQRGAAPTAPDYLVTIRAGYEDGHRRREELRRRLRESSRR